MDTTVDEDVLRQILRVIIGDCDEISNDLLGMEVKNLSVGQDFKSTRTQT